MKILFFTSLLIVVTTAQFPPFVKLCKRDANLNDCIKSNMNGAKGLLKNGIPSLFISKSDPLVIDPELVIVTPTLNTTHHKGFRYDGMDTFTVRDVNLDLDKNTLYIDWIWDTMVAHGDYKFEGKLLNFEVDGGDDCVVKVENMGVLLMMTGEREEKDGKSYLIFKKNDSKLELSKLRASIRFNKLFPSEKKTEEVNKLMNENQQAAINQFQPVVAGTVVRVVTGSIKKIFETYSIDELFTK